MFCPGGQYNSKSGDYPCKLITTYENAWRLNPDDTIRSCYPTYTLTGGVCNAPTP
jgi:hypothetical protein